MLIYAHRGASDDFPEHTEPAYLGAIEQGADGFECDVRLTRDEVPVLWHNSSMLERAGSDSLIAELTYEQVKIRYPQILNLNQFLDIAIGANKGVLIETKHPVISGNRVEEVVEEILTSRKVLNRIDVSVMSFSWNAIEKMHRINKKIPTTLLLRGKTPLLQAKFSSASSIGPGISMVRERPEIIEKFRQWGRSINLWTVDSGSDVELARDLGVDILITNKPAQARTFL
jgi:glycerophosphoryl diester phosphodiesterase